MKKKIYLLAIGLVAFVSHAMAEDIDLSAIVTALPPTVSYTVENDATYPWNVEDGIASIGYSSMPYKNESWVTMTVTCAKPTRVSVDYTAYTYTDSDQLRIVAENHTNSYYGSSKSGTCVHYLDAGVNTLKIGFVRNYSYSGSTNYRVSVSNIRFIDLDAEAIEINLSAAGSLGQEAIAALMETGKGQALPDMDYLKLTGPMNSADWDAISKMTALKYIDMEGTTVTDIPASAFTKTNLYYIKFPAGLKAIGNRAFYDRYLRGNLTFPSTLESIGEYAFYYNQISSLVLPASVTTIDGFAFRYNKSLRTLEYTTSMNSVPDYCFSDCSKLQTVTGLDNVTTVNGWAFADCSLLESVGDFVPTTINNGAFSGCNKLQSVDLSQATTIAGSAFSSCYALTEIDLTSLTSLGSYAFQYCNGLTSVTLNDKITSIPDYAFRYCSNLAVVNLGASVRKIGMYSFYSDANVLTSIYVKSPTPPTIEYATSYPPFYSRTVPTLYVPDYAMVSYKLADYWSAFTTVEANPYTPEELVLYGNLELTSNARIPNEPNVEMSWASSSAAGSSFIVNGDNPQPLGAFSQYVSHYKYSTNYDPCSSVLISRCANMTSHSSEVRFWCDSYNTYWYYVCMPFDVERSSIYCRNGASFAVRYYDGAARAENGAGNSWKDVPEDGILEAGKGYIFCTSKADYIILRATRETHNKIFTSSAVATLLDENSSTTSADAGWNLVGNPYSCFYDIYYMDYTAPITVWNTSNKSYTAYSVADDDLALYPLQAFFVQKPAGVDAVTFQPTGRQRTLAIEHAVAAPRRAPLAADYRRVINLTLSNGITEDCTRIVVNPYASDDYEAETDASKMMSYDATAQLFSLRDGIQYAINEGAQDDKEIALGAWFPADGEYTIDVARADCEVLLCDNGQAVTMPYTFTACAGTEDGRFTILIKGDEDGIVLPVGGTDGNGGCMYDLSGRRVSTAQKGIYVMKPHPLTPPLNGRGVIINCR